MILCWRNPVTYGYAPDYGDNVDFEKDARERIDALMDQVLSAHTAVSVETRVAEGPRQWSLWKQHGRRTCWSWVVADTGPLPGCCLGSTSQHCVNHATCPVVVVRAPTGDKPR